MPESIQHQQLVEQIKKEFESIIASDYRCFVCCDSATSAYLPPKTNDGYRPDVYYQYEDFLLIGEAKTSKDVEKRHSREQYETYVKECASFHGQAFLFLAVPWAEHATAHNILWKLKKRYPGNYTIKILKCLR